MVIIRRFCIALGGLCVLALLSGQATSPGIAVHVVAEVQKRGGSGGQSDSEFAKLTPADRVVPGDEIIYTLEIRNVAPQDLRAPTVTQAVPAHMMYVGESASGPGADITFSVDGGEHFDVSERLKTIGVDGVRRVAKASEYTHIRWHLRNVLKSRSVAFARFRAVVK